MPKCRNCDAELYDINEKCPVCGELNPNYRKAGETDFNLCNVMAIVVLIAGFIGSFYLAFKLGTKLEMPKYSFEDIKHVRDWGATIMIFITSAISTLVVYSILAALADIQERLR